MCGCHCFSPLLLIRCRGCVIPYDLILVLQCGSGLCLDFVAKILGVGTPLVLFNTQVVLPMLFT